MQTPGVFILASSDGCTVNAKGAGKKMDMEIFNPGENLFVRPSPFSLSRLTCFEIDKEIKRLPIVILPLGGCEAFGGLGTLGVASACAGALADAFSREHSILCAPVQHYSCSTPFMAYSGTSGTSGRTCANLIYETVRMWRFQGLRTVIIIDALFDNEEAVSLAALRLNQKYPDLKVVSLSLQHDRQICEFVGSRMPGKEPFRVELCLLSLAAAIDPDLVREPAAGADGATPDAELLKRWRKRGADPDQLKKIFPKGSCSPLAQKYRADFGKELFNYILTILWKRVVPVLDRKTIS